MKTSDTLKKASEVVDNWLKSRGYPQDFLRFFFQWTLLNLYYNAFSQSDEEMKKVLEFGREYDNAFNSVKEEVANLVRTECVGDGKYEAPPNSWVKTASLLLRKRLGINQQSICSVCREHKRRMCDNVNLESYNFGNMEALMRILYQIRCNLFHGDKTEYRDGEEAERNKMLVSLGNQVLEIVLKSIMQKY